ncbi:MAG: hypothetical protein ABL921_33760 [Pirellula sp.]
MNDWTFSCALYEAFRLGALLQNLKNGNVNTLDELWAMETSLAELLRQVADGELMPLDTHDRKQSNISSVRSDIQQQASKLQMAHNYRIEQLARHAEKTLDKDDGDGICESG